MFQPKIQMSNEENKKGNNSSFMSKTISNVVGIRGLNKLSAKLVLTNILQSTLGWSTSLLGVYICLFAYARGHVLQSFYSLFP